MSLRFDPTFSTPTLNNGQNISLIPGTVSRVYATGTVTDLNGYADLYQATSTFYRSGATGGAACTVNNNDCYRSTCTFTNCSGNSCTASCYADIYYFADPTDAGSTYSGQQWYAYLEARDTSAGYGFATTPSVEVNSLRAIDVTGPISYGSIAVSGNTGATNASSSVKNQGNMIIDLQISGTGLSDGGSSLIPANQQKFSTTTFSYGTCTTCHLLSSTSPYTLDTNIVKPTVVSPPVTSKVYWGVAVPYGTNNTPHSGMTVFTPT